MARKCNLKIVIFGAKAEALEFGPKCHLKIAIFGAKAEALDFGPKMPFKNCHFWGQDRGSRIWPENAI